MEHPPVEKKAEENDVFSGYLFLVLGNKILFLSFIHVDFLRFG
jgi:hypothetical protein